VSAPPRAPITAFRAEVAALLAGRARPGHVVVFAVDGLNVETARACWPEPPVAVLESVCPTTSSANWLSALTGADVAEHGVPGVVFTDPDAPDRLVHFLDYRGSRLTAPRENVFCDAAALGYLPLAVLGDLEGYASAWRDALLAHAVSVPGRPFFTEAGEYLRRSPAEVLSRVRAAVDGTLAAHGTDRPCFLWCYVELDQHVHRHGYDADAREFLAGLAQYARALVRRGAVVAAHADHGLVPTVHDQSLEKLLNELEGRHAFSTGGAGRMRWLYPHGRTRGEELAGALRRALPDSIGLRPADELFTPGSLARERVGELLLVAEGERFLTEPDYRFDHGSPTPAETDTPFTVWS
jgi:predicted AlkP superfamily pyrophosphatase or phosphodiesterase